MEVTYIDHMGTDLTVVNAARVSFDKESELETYCRECGSNDLRVTNTWARYVCNSCDFEDHGEDTPERLSDNDTRLIKYLAKHNHWTPFGHPQVTFRIKAPIFVARQLGKHQVGMVWNEVSRRYVDSEPEFYEPEVWRMRAENVKQGSSDEGLDISQLYGEFCNFEETRGVINTPIEGHDEALATYKSLLSLGVCPEQARMVLPQSMYSEWYWTGSLAAWARVCKLRLDSHTQLETRQIAKDISNEMEQLFPVSWEALFNE
jgi:thymidylate synthase (FAD)